MPSSPAARGRSDPGSCRAVAEAGAAVCIVDFDVDASDAAVAGLRDAGHRAIAAHADLTDRAACAAAVERTVEEFGGIDILVNLAQQFRATFVPFVDVTDEDMLVSWESGVMASFRMMQLCHPHLVARGGGAIVNFGSGAGTGGASGLVAYASAKEGIRALTKVAALEWGPDRIRVQHDLPVRPLPRSLGRRALAHRRAARQRSAAPRRRPLPRHRRRRSSTSPDRASSSPARPSSSTAVPASCAERAGTHAVERW